MMSVVQLNHHRDESENKFLMNFGNAALAITEVQYNDVLRVTGLFLTESTVSVLCWSNLNTFSNLTASGVSSRSRSKNMGVSLKSWVQEIF